MNKPKSRFLSNGNQKSENAVDLFRNGRLFINKRSFINKRLFPNLNENMKRERFVNNTATTNSYRCIIYQISIRTKNTKQIKRNTKMLRRFRNSRIRRTRKVKIKLWTSSIHLIAKRTRDLILVEQRFWGFSEDGQATAFSYNDYDEDTKKVIDQHCRNLRKLDFAISDISDDPKIQEYIRSLGYYHQPTGESWILLDQKTSTLQTPNHSSPIEETNQI